MFVANGVEKVSSWKESGESIELEREWREKIREKERKNEKECEKVVMGKRMKTSRIASRFVLQMVANFRWSRNEREKKTRSKERERKKKKEKRKEEREKRN